MVVNPHTYSAQHVSMAQQLVGATYRAQIANLYSQKQADIRQFLAPVVSQGAGGTAAGGSSGGVQGAVGVWGINYPAEGMFEGYASMVEDGEGMFEGYIGMVEDGEGMCEVDGDVEGAGGDVGDLWWCGACQQSVAVEYSSVENAATCVHCYRLLDCLQQY